MLLCSIYDGNLANPALASARFTSTSLAKWAIFGKYKSSIAIVTRELAIPTVKH